MTMNISAAFTVADTDELHELLTSLRELEPVHLIIDGHVAAIDRHADDDQTPPFGTERPACTDPFCESEHPHSAVHEWRELAIDIIPEREAYVASLVMWTRENITEGPIAEVSNAIMHDVYRRFVMWGAEDDRDYATMVTPAQLSCLRGAFRDAVGSGQVQ
jgi:hypothetical protein